MATQPTKMRTYAMCNLLTFLLYAASAMSGLAAFVKLEDVSRGGELVFAAFVVSAVTLLISAELLQLLKANSEDSRRILILLEKTQEETRAATDDENK